MRRISVLIASALIVASVAIYAQTPAPLIFDGRLAFSHDGNQHDDDDHGASAMVFAITWAFGMQHKFVHMDYSNHLGSNLSRMDTQMDLSCRGGPRHFLGIDSNVVFNCQTQLDEAIANFKKQAEMSGPGDTLAYMCAGPMEVAWRCLNAVSPDKRKFIKAISHSSWNEKHNDTPQMTHTWSSMKASFPEVRFIDISDQNANLGGGSNWNFLTSLPTDLPNLSLDAWTWLKSRVDEVNNTGDVSDCGMTWYCLTGNQKGQETDFKARFESPLAMEPVITRDAAIFIQTENAMNRIMPTGNIYYVNGRCAGMWPPHSAAAFIQNAGSTKRIRLMLQSHNSR